MDLGSLAAKRVRLLVAGIFLLVGAAHFHATPAYADLELVDDDITWPATAPVWTRSIPPFSAASRGVRGDRFQYQTFEVTEAFSLQSILIGYGWVGGTTGGPTNTNFTKVALYEITRTYNPPTLEDAFTLGNVVIPQFSFVIDGTGKSTNAQFYAMELGWDAETDGELILQPRTGLQGYALQINGTHVGQGSSAINLIERNGVSTDFYPGGRAYEYIGVAQTGPYGNGLYEFPIALTAVPEEDGDFNDDGTVDAADYVDWRTNNSGDQVAYNLWRSTFGNPSPGAGTGSLLSAAVPEPSTWFLMAAAAVLVGNCCRQRRSIRF